MISTKNLCCGAMLLGIAPLAYNQTSFATLITDTITYSPSQEVSHANSFGDTFDLTTQGFVVGTDTAVSGTAIFDLSSSDTGNQSNYKVTIDLASDQVIDMGGLQDYNITLSSGILSDINSTGQLGFTLFQDNSSVYYFLDSAELDVNTAVGSNLSSPVPDNSSTALLLGLSFLGFLGIRSFSGDFLRKATVKAR